MTIATTSDHWVHRASMIRNMVLIIAEMDMTIPIRIILMNNLDVILMELAVNANAL